MIIYLNSIIETISKRARLYNRLDGSDTYDTWKDLNVGIDIDIEYLKIHISSCNESTRQFYKEQLTHINEDEIDFNNKNRSKKNHYKTSLDGKSILSCDLHGWLNFSGIINLDRQHVLNCTMNF